MWRPRSAPGASPRIVIAARRRWRGRHPMRRRAGLPARRRAGRRSRRAASTRTTREHSTSPQRRAARVRRSSSLHDASRITLSPRPSHVARRASIRVVGPRRPFRACTGPRRARPPRTSSARGRRVACAPRRSADRASRCGGQARGRRVVLPVAGGPPIRTSRTRARARCAAASARRPRAAAPRRRHRPGRAGTRSSHAQRAVRDVEVGERGRPRRRRCGAVRVEQARGEIRGARAARDPSRGTRRRRARRRSGARRRTRGSRGTAGRRRGRRRRRRGGRRGRRGCGRRRSGGRRAARARRDTLRASVATRVEHVGVEHGAGERSHLVEVARPTDRAQRRRRAGAVDLGSGRRVAVEPRRASAAMRSTHAAASAPGRGQRPRAAARRACAASRRRCRRRARASSSGTTPRYTSGANRRFSATSRSRVAAAQRGGREVDERETDGLLELPDAIGTERQDRDVRLDEGDGLVGRTPRDHAAKYRAVR